MQTRYMERTNSMKRAREESSAGDGDGERDRKRPALARVIVEALKADSLQRLFSSMEPVLRRVVSEEVERALARMAPAKLADRSSPERIEGHDGRNLQLQFRTKLSLPLFTGGKVEGEQGAAIHIVLLDANNNQVVTSGPESSIKLDVVVLEGDFNTEDGENWSEEDFESHVVKEREGKRPLLTGDLQVTLKQGVGTLGDLTFTDNSSWIRSRKFRLGVRVTSGFCEGVCIREAKTEAFGVKDHRGELYKKHYPPALTDEVWRLEKIGKDGSFHKRLNEAGINTVEDFLRGVVRDSTKLRRILGGGMSNKMWDVLIEHAKTCALGGKLYVYYPNDAQGIGVIFNNIYEFSGLIASEQYHPADSLSDSQKVYADNLVKKAYDDWMNMVEYDGESLLSLKPNKGENSSRNVASFRQPSANSYDAHLSTPNFLLPPDESPLDLGLINKGSAAKRYSNDYKHLTGPSHAHNQLFSSHQNHIVEDNITMSSLVPPSTMGFQPTPSTNNYRGIEDYVTEEEIRARSHEMLEHEDMQSLLRMFNMGGSHANYSQNVMGDMYTDSTGYTPRSSTGSYGLDDEDRGRPSGKAVVGWLKLKAALRWGIFVRKKAAERRAQLVELDEM
ncbi:hypothetical protein Droror1_Dr00016551 [Drosera rotundifolia]